MKFEMTYQSKRNGSKKYNAVVEDFRKTIKVGKHEVPCAVEKWTLEDVMQGDGIFRVGSLAAGRADLEQQRRFLLAGVEEQTRDDDFFIVIQHRTRWYHQDKSGIVRNAGVLDSSYKIPGGGWLSSAEDMASFEVAMFNDRVVNRATRDVMWASQRTSDGKETGYALGWGTGKDLGVLDVGHGGGQQGTSTFIMMIPERRAGVVVLINLDGADSSALATDLMKILLGAGK